MTHTLTVKQAIYIGHLMINVPIMLIFWGLTIGPVLFLSVSDIAKLFVLLLSLVLAFVATWLYWSLMITQWRLWAFERVDNAYELMQIAVEQRLIWPAGSIFEKTEIRTRRQQAKWHALQHKIAQAAWAIGVQAHDPAISVETISRYAKGASVLKLIVYLFGLILVLGVVTSGPYKDLLGYLPVLLLVWIYVVYVEYIKIVNREPQIILNHKGIWTTKAGFHPWSSIRDESVVLDSGATGEYTYLRYSHRGRTISIRIDDHDISANVLARRLMIYRFQSHCRRKSSTKKRKIMR